MNFGYLPIYITKRCIKYRLEALDFFFSSVLITDSDICITRPS